MTQKATTKIETLVLPKVDMPKNLSMMQAMQEEKVETLQGSQDKSSTAKFDDMEN